MFNRLNMISSRESLAFIAPVPLEDCIRNWLNFIIDECNSIINSLIGTIIYTLILMYDDRYVFDFSSIRLRTHKLIKISSDDCSNDNNLSQTLDDMFDNMRISLESINCVYVITPVYQRDKIDWLSSNIDRIKYPIISTNKFCYDDIVQAFLTYNSEDELDKVNEIQVLCMECNFTIDTFDSYFYDLSDDNLINEF